MAKRSYLILFLLGLAVAIGGAALQTTPGYMDAYYYFYGGQQLAHGNGFTENFIWNYLNDPQGLPQPAFAYWMPLTSLVAAAGIKLFSWLPDFEAAQIVFVLATACIPPLAAGLSFAFSGKRKFALLSGVLAAFLGFYQPFLTTTDGFTLYMLLGGLFFLVFLKVKRGKALLFGLLAGLFHLTRADGVLWLGLAWAALAFDGMGEDKFSIRGLLGRVFRCDFLFSALTVLGAYLLVMSPWYVRNVQVFGSLFPPGNGYAIWVTDYEDLFIYPASTLTFERWWNTGIGEILRIRLDTVWHILTGSMAEMGVLLPGILALIGAIRLRANKAVWLGWGYWGALALIMSLFFPFATQRGTFYHSSAALIPLVMALASVGLDLVVEKSLKFFSHWQDQRIRPFYTGILLVVVIGFSLYNYTSKVIGFEGQPYLLWDEDVVQYSAVDEELQRLGIAPDEVVLTTQPPTYTVLSGRPTVAMPRGGLEAVLNVVQDFDVQWVLSEEGYPVGGEEAYSSPEDLGLLHYLGTVSEIHIYRVEP